MTPRRRRNPRTSCCRSCAPWRSRWTPSRRARPPTASPASRAAFLAACRAFFAFLAAFFSSRVFRRSSRDPREPKPARQAACTAASAPPAPSCACGSARDPGAHAGSRADVRRDARAAPHSQHTNTHTDQTQMREGQHLAHVTLASFSHNTEFVDLLSSLSKSLWGKLLRGNAGKKPVHLSCFCEPKVERCHNGRLLSARGGGGCICYRVLGVPLGMFVIRKRILM